MSCPSPSARTKRLPLGESRVSHAIALDRMRGGSLTVSAVEKEAQRMQAHLPPQMSVVGAAVKDTVKVEGVQALPLVFL